MHPLVETRIDVERGCGWRQPGGLYLVSGAIGMPCGRLPIELTVCPTCSCGVKPARGWTWIESGPFLADRECQAEPARCLLCPLSRRMGKVGLLWIGEKFYATPGDFIKEADRIGISRRIPALPTGFVIGQTWVWLAHRKSISRVCDYCKGNRSLACDRCDEFRLTWHPAVFRAFRPQAIEYVTKGDETDEEIGSLLSRGITPVKVIREEETQADLFTEAHGNGEA